MNSAVEAFGHVDIVIANHAYGTLGKLEELTSEAIDAHLEVNVRGTRLLIQVWALSMTIRVTAGASSC